MRSLSHPMLLRDEERQPHFVPRPLVLGECPAPRALCRWPVRSVPRPAFANHGQYLLARWRMTAPVRFRDVRLDDRDEFVLAVGLQVNATTLTDRAHHSAKCNARVPARQVPSSWSSDHDRGTRLEHLAAKHFDEAFALVRTADAAHMS